MLPQDFLAHFGAVSRHFDAVAMNARHRLAHGVDGNAWKDLIPDVRHVRH
jgi:hypothetical protein